MRLPTVGARRDHAERYLFLVIAGFAVSVAATRWFLDATGYPKVGGGGLHVAHMLWGGLLLVVAATLPLVFVGRRVLLLSAVAGGVGVGLFIDEIGKFITESNDYFFAPAAPLIYSAILLMAAIWLIVARRGQPASAHEDVQAGVEALREAVDGQLTPAVARDVCSGGSTVPAAGVDPGLAGIASAQAGLLALARRGRDPRAAGLGGDAVAPAACSTVCCRCASRASSSSSACSVRRCSLCSRPSRSSPCWRASS